MSERCTCCGQAMPELADVHQLALGPFSRTSDTSRRAALDAYPRQGSQRERILCALAVAPLTRDELVRRLALRGNSIRPRVRELIEGGWVMGTGKTRKTGTGSDAEVLGLTERARQQMAVAA